MCVCVGVVIGIVFAVMNTEKALDDPGLMLTRNKSSGNSEKCKVIESADWTCSSDAECTGERTCSFRNALG